MRFVEIGLDGFGKLVDCTFAFAPGLNLVFGLNEAGKSTLQQALLTLLYGFYEEGTVTRGRQEAAKALTPWVPGTSFSGWLIYQLNNDQAFLVTRTFSGRPTTRLVTAPDGRDISSEYPMASHGRLFFADSQLGMSKDIFESTCVVRQAELLALEKSAQAITDTLMRLSASASQDTTTADALALLDEALRDKVGTDRAWTKPLAQARQYLNELQTTQRQVAEAQREVFTLVGELNQEQAALAELDHDVERLRYLSALAEQKALQAQVDASIQADEEAAGLAAEVERWKPWADFPAHLRDQVIGLHRDRIRLAEEIDDQSQRIKEAGRQRSVLRSRLDAVEATLAGLIDAKDVPVERWPQAQKLAARLESVKAAERGAQTRLLEVRERLAQAEKAMSDVRAALGSIADLGAIGLAQLQQEWYLAQQRLEPAQTTLREAWATWSQVGMSEEQFLTLAQTARQIAEGAYVEVHPRNGCRFWIRPKGPPPPPPEAAIYAQIRPIHDRWQTANVEILAAKENFVAVEGKIRHHFALEPDQQVQKAHFEAANQQVTAHTRLSSQVDVQREALSAAETDAQGTLSEVQIAQDDLSRILSTIGYSVTDLQVAVQSFEEDCKRKVQYDHAAADLERLHGEDRLLSQEEQAQAHREEALRIVCQSLRATLTQAGIAVVGEDLSGAVGQFEERHGYHQRWLRAQESYHAALARPATGLTQQDREVVRKRLDTLHRDVDRWRSIRPEWAELEADHDAHEYRDHCQKLEETRLTKQQRCTKLRGSLEQATARLTHPAELVEKIAIAQARLGRLEYLREVLTLAREELVAATQDYQRALAPRLERLVADGMARATRGRYSQVGVDPSTLAVTLVAPERDEPVEAGLLSTGTRDLVYLLLRIGIARLMSRTGETLPLLLDDPLVQLDCDRQEHTLQLLVDLAEETQIILFTKDDDLLRWFQNELAGSEKHQLHILS